jgi:hypothetical protein
VKKTTRLPRYCPYCGDCPIPGVVVCGACRRKKARLWAEVEARCPGMGGDALVEAAKRVEWEMLFGKNGGPRG